MSDVVSCSICGTRPEYDLTFVDQICPTCGARVLTRLENQQAEAKQLRLALEVFSSDGNLYLQNDRLVKTIAHNWHRYTGRVIEHLRRIEEK